MLEISTSDSFTLTLFKLGAPSMISSASLTIILIAWTLSMGYVPAAVSPLSITASAPSRTAVPTSVTSALVGRGFLCILSNICVATITGFPLALHFSTIIFWAANTFRNGISTPRSPLATMIPSLSARISSKLSTPSLLSILLMTRGRRGRGDPSVGSGISAIERSRKAFTERTFPSVRMNEAATKSAPTSQLHFKSRLSLSVRAGRSSSVFGRLTPLFFLIGPEFNATHVTLLFSTCVTFSAIKPSSSNT
mmetsp:Transcript_16763/g.40078  ORF Transcript_16763/g.40078 Transcript_16763/m.40078 type:complete len:251 (-) Transcript_16763:628-1380(-)